MWEVNERYSKLRCFVSIMMLTCVIITNWHTHPSSDSLLSSSAFTRTSKLQTEFISTHQHSIISLQNQDHAAVAAAGNNSQYVI